MEDAKRKKIIDLLRKAFNMEIETVINYLANSIYLDGLRANHIREALAEDVQEELGHAQRLAERIKILDGNIPGSMDLKMEQKQMQPPKDSLDHMAVIRGVIAAEEAAIEHYQKIIEATDQVDMVTQDLCIELKGDEEGHRRLFLGFLREFEAGRK